MSRNHIAVCLSLLIGVLAPASAFAAPKAKPNKKTRGPVMKLGTIVPVDSSPHLILQQMGQKWKNAPDGVELKIYAGGTRGGEAEMVSLMGTGNLDAALLSVVGLSGIDESVEALQSMPMMFRSLDEVDYVGEKLRPRLEKKLRDKGFVVLFWADAGWVRFFSTEPVLRPADLKRMKLFTWAGDVRAITIYKAAGYTPIPLETNDILPGLNTKMINAVPLPPYFALAMQVYTTATHMLELNWAPLVGALVVREEAWEKLSQQTRKALATAAEQAGGQMRAQNRTDSDKAVEAMAKRKLKVHKVTPEIEAEWRKDAEGSYKHIRGKIVPADLFDEVQRLLADYRSSPKKAAETSKPETEEKTAASAEKPAAQSKTPKTSKPAPAKKPAAKPAASKSAAAPNKTSD